ncbi:hypothetical protein NECAME_17142 [Necator americanus]|uniref:Netrin module non-TIMP type domain-containing protein n=1 Tax=Necator americanus TaxID=51031 RepID=W2TTM7_NECAM|nr:hypothetical protein NECAME_17142 [Necator americanus]ETN84456.1 hypothetical protein NECAME_17142 [Necator americanus]
MKGLLILVICLSSAYRSNCQSSGICRHYGFAVQAKVTEVLSACCSAAYPQGRFIYKVEIEETYKGDMEYGKSYMLYTSPSSCECNGLDRDKTYLLIAFPPAGGWICYALLDRDR